MSTESEYQLDERTDIWSSLSHGCDKCKKRGLKCVVQLHYGRKVICDRCRASNDGGCSPKYDEDIRERFHERLAMGRRRPAKKARKRMAIRNFVLGGGHRSKKARSAASRIRTKAKPTVPAAVKPSAGVINLGDDDDDDLRVKIEGLMPLAMPTAAQTALRSTSPPLFGRIHVDETCKLKITYGLDLLSKLVRSAQDGKVDAAVATFIHRNLSDTLVEYKII